MRIRRTSPMTGKTVSRSLRVTTAELRAWDAGSLIQDAMPHLSPADREWLQTGLTTEDWVEMRGREGWNEEENN